MTAYYLTGHPKVGPNITVHVLEATAEQDVKILTVGLQTSRAPSLGCLHSRRALQHGPCAL